MQRKGGTTDRLDGGEPIERSDVDPGVARQLIRFMQVSDPNDALDHPTSLA
jgi:hypothetical protein